MWECGTAHNSETKSELSSNSMVPFRKPHILCGCLQTAVSIRHVGWGGLASKCFVFLRMIRKINMCYEGCGRKGTSWYLFWRYHVTKKWQMPRVIACLRCLASPRQLKLRWRKFTGSALSSWTPKLWQNCIDCNVLTFFCFWNVDGISGPIEQYHESFTDSFL